MNLSSEDQAKLMADFCDAVELAEEAIPYAGQHFRDKFEFDERLSDLKEGIAYYETRASADGD